jgi:hypothetical protein
MRYVTSIGRGDSEDAIFIFMTGEETGAELGLNEECRKRGAISAHEWWCLFEFVWLPGLRVPPQTITNVRSRSFAMT